MPPLVPGGAQHALLIDVSMRRAFSSDGDPECGAGDLFTVGFENTRAAVEARRVSPTDDPKRVITESNSARSRTFTVRIVSRGSAKD